MISNPRKLHRCLGTKMYWMVLGSVPPRTRPAHLRQNHLNAWEHADHYGSQADLLNTWNLYFNKLRGGSESS